MERKTPADLCPSAILPTAMDDQWVNRNQLYHYALDKEATDNAAEIEFKRCLLSGKEVILNRAFIVNSGVLHAAYKPAEAQGPIKTLIGTGAIVPYLHEAEDHTLDGDEVAKKIPNLNNWIKITDGSDVTNLRFDWENDKNKLACDSLLVKRFHDRLLSIENSDIPNLYGKFSLYRSNEGLRIFSSFVKDDFIPFVKDKKKIKRDEIYKKFGLGRADICGSGREHHQIIKQIVDTVYNSNLSDALDVTAVTAQGTATRSDLSESLPEGAFMLSPKKAAEMIEEAAQICRAFRSDRLSNSLKDVTIKNLTYANILEIRGFDEWKAYVIQGVELSKQLSADEGSDPVSAVLARLKTTEEVGCKLRERLRKYLVDDRFWHRRTDGIVNTASDFIISLGAGTIGSCGGILLASKFSINETIAGAFGFLAGFFLERQLTREHYPQALDFLLAPSGMDAVAQMLPRFKIEEPEEAAREIVSILNPVQANEIDLHSAAEGQKYTGKDAPTYG